MLLYDTEDRECGFVNRIISRCEIQIKLSVVSPDIDLSRREKKKKKSGLKWMITSDGYDKSCAWIVLNTRVSRVLLVLHFAFICQGFVHVCVCACVREWKVTSWPLFSIKRDRTALAVTGLRKRSLVWIEMKWYFMGALQIIRNRQARLLLRSAGWFLLWEDVGCPLTPLFMSLLP